MIWQWTSQFENSPTGKDIGGVTAYEIKRHKEALGERISAQHDISPADPPLVTHRVGYCSIVLEVEDEETATPKLVDGALQYQAGDLKRDNGSILEDVVSRSHLSLINVGSAETEHPDYLNAEHSQGFENLQGALDMNSKKITGLPTSGFSSNDQILSHDAHMGNNAVTGCKHSDGVITAAFSDIKMYGAKLKLTDDSHTMNTVGWHEVNFGQYATFPRLDTAGTSQLIIGLTSESDVDNYVGRLRVYCPEALDYTLRWKRLNVS